ncbi:hypothetical protein [Leifsonia sp. C5G2]|uniref:hypothetical protein n=1 Tax=Leifsonia sp. C5G2 TaxID=2735269 RepID=UPI00158490FF|nr:hypothetical protein [Leifsonia sp. C5G2]NUU08256.1 hypothetical protein [Leifsonia sp. C5G2]
MDPSLPTGVSRPSGWIIVGASGLGLASAYWDDSWHSTLGRDSALIPPHLLLYASIVAVGVILGLWAMRILRDTRSLSALGRAPGFILAAASAAATAIAAPADAFWHSTFGRDAVLWSPPHLLSVISTTVLLGAMLVSVSDRPWRQLQIGLSAVVLAAAQILVMEYDTDVPQFSETLYLPVALLSLLSAGWVIIRTTRFPFALTTAIVAYILLRAALTAGLTGAGWLAPDLPLALLGLAAVDLLQSLPRLRWLVAASIVAALESLLSAIRLSNVQIGSILPWTMAVVGAALVAVFVVGVRNRAVTATIVLLLGLSFALVTPVPASAHDPGQGPSFGTAALSVQGDGSGELTVTVDDFSTTATMPGRAWLVARRAGQTITVPLAAGSVSRSGRATGRISLPHPGLWFVYADVSSYVGTLEVWLPISQNFTGTITQTRALYQPTETREWSPPQYLFALSLVAIGAVLVVWLMVRVRRVPTSGATERPYTSGAPPSLPGR